MRARPVIAGIILMIASSVRGDPVPSPSPVPGGGGALAEKR